MRKPIVFAEFTLTAALALAFKAVIASNPAQATMTETNLHAFVKPPLTEVHCRRVYHCFWDTQDHRKYRRCHVCG
jgi:hypothetical protein